jgi:MFS family permease
MLLIESSSAFYLRFALGAAEAGFFPGILVYLNRWYPAGRRAQVTALFAIAVPLAGVVGGPLSGAILAFMHDTAACAAGSGCSCSKAHLWCCWAWWCWPCCRSISKR